MTAAPPAATARRRRATLVALALLALGGCGYSLQGTLPEHVRTVAIPIFVNRTVEPAVENVLTRAVVEAFSTDGRLRVVTPAEADSILEGEVTRFVVEPIAFDRAANVQLYRLLVTLNLRYRDVRRNVVLFERVGLHERADFRAAPLVAETIAREETALEAAARDIARTVVSLTVERF
jgi:outer membrane lipopolysaccharide assembly protein LptE/RlpB